MKGYHLDYFETINNYIVFCIIQILERKVKILLDALCLYRVYLTVYHPFCNDIQKTPGHEIEKAEAYRRNYIERRRKHE